MRYENPKIPEGINVSKSHPLLDFGALLAGVASLFGIFLASVYLLAGWLLPYIPFSTEHAILQHYQGEVFPPANLTEDELEIQRYLQSLADKLIATAALPSEIAVTVHYSSNEQKNAYATLGGNILVHAGLLKAIETENGLAMVLGHEIGHIVNRDPLMTTGRGAVAMAAIGLLSGFSETRVAGTVFNISSESLLFSFSRDQERAADDFSLELLGGYYGHRRGADEFFRHVLEEEPDSAALIEFFSTHPDPEQRLEHIEKSIAGEARSTTPLIMLRTKNSNKSGHSPYN